MTMKMKLKRGPSVDLCSFGSSYAFADSLASYYYGLFQEAGIINVIYENDVFPPWSDVSIVTIMKTMMTCSEHINKDLKN